MTTLPFFIEQTFPSTTTYDDPDLGRRPTRGPSAGRAGKRAPSTAFGTAKTKMATTSGACAFRRMSRASGASAATCSRRRQMLACTTNPARRRSTPTRATTRSTGTARCGPTPHRSYFAHADGTPFFYLGDTAWNGVLKANPDDWRDYLATRAASRALRTIQAVMTQWRAFTADGEGEHCLCGRQRQTRAWQFTPNFTSGWMAKSPP